MKARGLKAGERCPFSFAVGSVSSFPFPPPDVRQEDNRVCYVHVCYFQGYPHEERLELVSDALDIVVAMEPETDPLQC